MDLAGAFDDLKHFGLAEHAGHVELLDRSVTAMNLHREIGHLAGEFARKELPQRL